MLLTFLSRYLCTIGHLECLALGRGRPRFTQNFTGSALLGNSLTRPIGFVYRSFTFYGSSFQRDSTTARYGNLLTGLAPSPKAPATPTTHRRKAIACNRFRLFPFRSPLLGESHSLSSPPLTEMFQFSGLPLPWLYIHQGVT